MKGIVFHQFFEMVDTTIFPERTEKLIAQSDLRSGSAHTSVGTYYPADILSSGVGQHSLFSLTRGR